MESCWKNGGIRSEIGQSDRGHGVVLKEASDELDQERMKNTEGNYWNQVCQWDSYKQQPGEASSVTPFGGVRLQVHKKGCQ